MSKVEILNEEELANVVGGKGSKIRPNKALKCLSGLTTGFGIGVIKGSAFGAAWGLAKASVLYCGVGPQPQKVY